MVLVMGFALAVYMLLRVDLRTGLLINPRLLHGEIREGMVPVKAVARTLYFHKGKWLDFIPGNNAHDLLFFPVKPGELASAEVAIVTYHPWYPPFVGSSPLFSAINADTVDSDSETIIRFGGYEYLSDAVKCMIVGNGKFSKSLERFELWYFPSQ
jgi:hypothetical protein